jgi:type I restriction enzyme S subunit
MSKVHKLSDVADYCNDRINIKSVSLSNFVTTDSLLPNKMGLDRAVNLPPQQGNMPAFSANDILVGNIRPYLKKIWFSDRNGGCSADVLVFRAKDGYDPKFIYYSMFRDDFFSHMMRGSKGTKMPRGDKTQIMEFMLPKIAKPEQENISTLLSIMDEKIIINNCINAELEATAKTLYDYWFVQFDFPDANGKPYKSSGGKMEYNPTLKRHIPAGWGDDSLWNIANYYNGLPMQKYRPTSNDYLRVIKIKEMGEGFSDKSELARKDISSEAIVNNGDVLFSWSATLEVQIWSKGQGALNQHIFKVTSEKYPRTFYYYELRNYLQHFKMMADKRKTTMGHITQEHLKQSRISIPPSSLIDDLDSRLQPIFDKHLILEQENQQLTQLRDWLLPMLMNGQVKISTK